MNGAGEAPYASFFIEFQNICNSSSSNNICTSQSSSNIVLHKIPLIFVFHRVPFIVAYFFQISNKSTIWERSALVARCNLVLIGSPQSRSNWFSKFRSSSAWNLLTNYRREHSTSSARHPSAKSYGLVSRGSFQLSPSHHHHHDHCDPQSSSSHY